MPLRDTDFAFAFQRQRRGRTGTAIEEVGSIQAHHAVPIHIRVGSDRLGSAHEFRTGHVTARRADVQREGGRRGGLRGGVEGHDERDQAGEEREGAEVENAAREIGEVRHDAQRRHAVDQPPGRPVDQKVGHRLPARKDQEEANHHGDDDIKRHENCQNRNDKFRSIAVLNKSGERKN